MPKTIYLKAMNKVGIEQNDTGIDYKQKKAKCKNGSRECKQDE